MCLWIYTYLVCCLTKVVYRYVFIVLHFQEIRNSIMGNTRKIFERGRRLCYFAKQLQRHDREYPNRLYSSQSKLMDQSFVDPSIPLNFINLKPHIPVILKNGGEKLQYERTCSDQIIVYTDGSCLFNNQMDTNIRKGGLGVYWGSDDHPYNLSIPHGGNKLSSSRAEIASAHAAILIARFARIRNLCLRTDSKNLVNSFTTWMPRWKAANWVSMSTGRPIKNQDMLKKLADELKFVTVEFQHHSDNVKGIEKAHFLAQNGAKLSS